MFGDFRPYKFRGDANVALMEAGVMRTLVRCFRVYFGAGSTMYVFSVWSDRCFTRLWCDHMYGLHATSIGLFLSVKLQLITFG